MTFWENEVELAESKAEKASQFLSRRVSKKKIVDDPSGLGKGSAVVVPVVGGKEGPSTIEKDEDKVLSTSTAVEGVKSVQDTPNVVLSKVVPLDKMVLEPIDTSTVPEPVGLDASNKTEEGGEKASA